MVYFVYFTCIINCIMLSISVRSIQKSRVNLKLLNSNLKRRYQFPISGYGNVVSSYLILVTAFRLLQQQNTNVLYKIHYLQKIMF